VDAAELLTLRAAELCDAAVAQPGDERIRGEASVVTGQAREAAAERLLPGAGELPVRALVDAVGPDVVLGVEAPSRRRAELGVPAAVYAAQAMDAVLRLRPRLERLWGMAEDDAAALVNALLREASALPQLVKHDQWDYHLHATPPDAPLADRMAVEAAMAFTDVIRSGQLDRLRVCAADHCADVHVDLSKNRSRRFCSVACANRTNVAAYRIRQASR